MKTGFTEEMDPKYVSPFGINGGNAHDENLKKQKQIKALGGWKSMPFIMGNELCEKFASVALSSNMISYLMKDYHMKQVVAATVLSLFSGASSLTPLLGAFISDAYLGRFWTIVYGSFFNFLGSMLLTISAISVFLRPLPRQQASVGQLIFLCSVFTLSAIGAGGLRPCCYAFGADQFRIEDSPEEKKKIQSFFNWYFFFLYVSHLLGATVLVYVQDNVGWGWGFGIPSIAMAVAIVVFLLGFCLYRHDPPKGSPFVGLAQVIVAAFHKRKENLHDASKLYDSAAPAGENNLCHTSQFKFFDHAAIKLDGDFEEDGKVRDPWKLCSVNQVEQLKTLIRLGPIWLSNMLSATALSQHGIFNVPQAITTNRHIGRSFQIPAASLNVFGIVTMILWVPIYDCVVIPLARRLTGTSEGIKMLQRVGIGLVISVFGLIISGIVETKRREVAKSTGFFDKPQTATPFSVFWLVPQYCIFGLGEAFHSIGQLEFLYDQLPNNMRSMAGAVFWCGSAIGHFLGTFIVQIVHRATTVHGKVGWLDDNLNKGHLDYFYYVLAGLQLLNVAYFLFIAKWYTYKKTTLENRHEEDGACQMIIHKLSAVHHGKVLCCNLVTRKRGGRAGLII